MSTNPTTRMADRRRFIADRTVQLKTELEALSAEAAELDVAERVLKRFSDPPSIGGLAEQPPARVPNSTETEEETEPLSLPQMVFIILDEAKAAGRKGVDGSEILSTIKARWKPEFTADNVRPTLWRMVKKEGRLRKRGKIYSRPIVSSPEGETGALGAPVHH